MAYRQEAKMSLPHVILGFLRYGPSTGYDLKKVFDASVRHFWPAQQSHIYQALNKLSEEGWIKSELIPQTDRPNRKLFHITPAGRDELQRWLCETRSEKPTRIGFLVQVFFAGELPDADILRILEAKAAEIRVQLARLAGEVSVPDHAQLLPAREQFFWYLTLDFGIESARSSLSWLEGAIARIRNKAYEKGIQGALVKRSPE
jgi:PadR family transcriptional regulator AphA